jgi:hypothetical protein
MPSTILSDNGVTSGSAGLKTTAASDGALALQTTTAGGAATTALTIDTSQNATFAGSVKTNTLTSAASTALTLQSAGTTAITVNTSQNVGIGTTTPTAGYKLNVGSTSAVLTLEGAAITLFTSGSLTSSVGGVLNFRPQIGTTINDIFNLSICAYDHSGDGNADGLSINGSDGVSFSTGANSRNERMRINSSGNVGIGSSTITSADGSAGRILKVSGATNTVLVGETTGNGGFNALILEARNSNRTNARFAQIQMQTTSTATDGGLISFSTSATGTGTDITERMRIDSAGNVLMGQTTASNSSFLLNCVGGGFLTTRVNIGDNGGFVDGSTIYLGSDSTNSSSWNQSNANYRFGSNRGGCVVAINPSGYTYEGGSGTTTRTFAVNANGNVQNTNNSYGSLSDAKLKENIVDASPKLNDLMRVKIRNFNLIADEAKTKQIGVVAQELEEIFPSMIDEHIDYTFEEYIKEDGSKDSKGIPTGTVTKEVKYSVFVPMLIKAIQELKAINDTQAATINALTARIVALEQA